MILTVYGEQIQCDKAIKGSGYIEMFLPDGDVRMDSGITDFSGYSLTDEQGNPVPFMEPELDEITQLKLALTELYEEVLSRG